MERILVVVVKLRHRTNGLFQLLNMLKSGHHFEDLFQACARLAPVTFLTGDHVYKLGLTGSYLQPRQQEICVRDYGNQPLLL